MTMTMTNIGMAPVDLTGLATIAYVDSIVAHDSTYDFSSDVNHTNATTTWEDVVGVDAPITTIGTNKVLVILTGMCWHSSAAGDVFVRITRDDETANSLDTQAELKTADIRVPFSIVWIDSPGAGAHNYEPQFRTSVGPNTASVRDVCLAVVELMRSE